MGNPFSDMGNELVILDTRDVVEEEIKDGLLGLSEMGQQQFTNFIEERLQKQEISIETPKKEKQCHLAGKNEAERQI